MAVYTEGVKPVDYQPPKPVPFDAKAYAKERWRRSKYGDSAQPSRRDPLMALFGN